MRALGRVGLVSDTRVCVGGARKQLLQNASGSRNSSANAAAASVVDNCAAGYAGSLCSVCHTGYYRKNNACVQCPDNAWILIALFVAAAIAVGALVQWLVKRRQQLKGTQVNLVARICKLLRVRDGRAHSCRSVARIL